MAREASHRQERERGGGGREGGREGGGSGTQRVEDDGRKARLSDASQTWDLPGSTEDLPPPPPLARGKTVGSRSTATETPTRGSSADDDDDDDDRHHGPTHKD